MLDRLSFSEADPEVHWGQIRDVLLCLDGYPLKDKLHETLLARIDNQSGEPGAIRIFSVIGQKAAPAQNDVELSHDRRTKGRKRHKLVGHIDETNDANYNFLVSMANMPNVQLRVWYATDSHVYGGLGGILAHVSINHIVPLSDNDIERFEFEIQWSGVDPERLDSPLSHGGGNDEPIGTIEVYREKKGYPSGSTYVTFANTESPDKAFRHERLYRCTIGAAAHETPETNPEKWGEIGSVSGGGTGGRIGELYPNADTTTTRIGMTGDRRIELHMVWEERKEIFGAKVVVLAHSRGVEAAVRYDVADHIGFEPVLASHVIAIKNEGGIFLTLATKAVRFIRYEIVSAV